MLWAKRGSGVNKPTNEWTEEDNDKIKKVKDSDPCFKLQVKIEICLQGLLVREVNCLTEDHNTGTLRSVENLNCLIRSPLY